MNVIIEPETGPEAFDRERAESLKKRLLAHLEKLFDEALDRQDPVYAMFVVPEGHESAEFLIEISNAEIKDGYRRAMPGTQTHQTLVIS